MIANYFKTISMVTTYIPSPSIDQQLMSLEYVFLPDYFVFQFLYMHPLASNTFSLRILGFFTVLFLYSDL